MEHVRSLLSETLRAYTSAMIKEAVTKGYIAKSMSDDMSMYLQTGDLSMESIRQRVTAEAREASNVEFPFRVLAETYRVRVKRVVDRFLELAPLLEANRLHAEDVRRCNDRGYETVSADWGRDRR